MADNVPAYLQPYQGLHDNPYDAAERERQKRGYFGGLLDSVTDAAGHLVDPATVLHLAKQLNPVGGAINSYHQARSLLSGETTPAQFGRSLLDQTPIGPAIDTVKAAGDVGGAAGGGDSYGAGRGTGALLGSLAAVAVPGAGRARKVAAAERAIPAADRAVTLSHNMPPPDFQLRQTDVFPQLADRYPTVGPPVLKVDKDKGKEFLGKQLTPEALDVQKARGLIQQDINEGKYTPYFDPAKRFDVDPSKYEPRVDTTALRMKKDTAQAKYDAIAKDPEAMQRLNTTYEQGMKQVAGAGNWYMMGQLEKAFIDEYGPTQGRVMFKQRFADAMAATTGGADPTSNLLTATYGNYLHARGEAFPTEAHQVPYPVGGGKYGVMPNLEQYDKIIMQGGGIDAPTNPKRYNFSGNFLGNTGNATIDEQMMGIIQPGGPASPPKGSYGHYEGGVVGAAQAAGTDPRTFQEVGWAGKKDADIQAANRAKLEAKGLEGPVEGYRATPMIQHVNETIERTSRLTGLSPAEVVRRGLVRAEIPLYGVPGLVGAGGLAAAASGGGGLLSGQPEDQQQY